MDDLQDRFRTAQGTDTRRLFFLAGHLNVARTPVEDWKLQVGNTACHSLPGRGPAAGCQ